MSDKPKKPKRRIDFPIPAGTETTTCRHCSAEIAWVRHERTGNPMPLDVRTAVRIRNQTRAESHHAHCPKAARLRRARDRRRRATSERFCGACSATVHRAQYLCPGCLDALPDGLKVELLRALQSAGPEFRAARQFATLRGLILAELQAA